MARRAVTVTLGASLGEGRFNSTAAHSKPASVDVTAAVSDLSTLTTNVATAQGTLETNVVNAVAVLVADGALPTQGHVDTLNTAWGLLKTAIDALSTAAVSADLTAVAADEAGDVVIDWNATNVTTKNGLRAAIKSALVVVDGSDDLT